MGQSTAIDSTCWTDDAIARLRQLWIDGMPTIAIGRSLGLSKNAIIGKAHRMELPARPSPIVRDGRVKLASKPARTPVPSLTKLETTAKVLPTASGARSIAVAQRTRGERETGLDRLAKKSIKTATDAETAAATQSGPIVSLPMTIDDQANRHAKVNLCCWPIGEPCTRSFRFCDEPAPTGRPYCDEHTQRAYGRSNRTTAPDGPVACD